MGLQSFVGALNDYKRYRKHPRPSTLLLPTSGSIQKERDPDEFRVDGTKS